MKNIEQLTGEEAVKNPGNLDILPLMVLEVLKDEVCEENLFALECIKRAYAKRGYVNPELKMIINRYGECIGIQQIRRENAKRKNQKNNVPPHLKNL